jgi:Protein of unknown function (DUF3108)
MVKVLPTFSAARPPRRLSRQPDAPLAMGFGRLTLRGHESGTRIAGALLALWMTVGLSIAHAQTRLDATYRVTLVGVPIGNVAGTLDIDQNRFIAAASGATFGLLRVFSSGHGNVAAHGAVVGGQPMVSNYALKVSAGRWSDDVQISFTGGKAKEIVNSPPSPPDPNRVPLTDAHREGVVDPMTALLIHIPGNADTAVPKACDRVLAVFDGRTRYDVRLSFKRIDQVKTEAGYQGPVVVCSLYFSPVAGYDPQRFAIKYLEAQRDMEISLAPIAGTRLLMPYRVSIPTPLGLGVLQAIRFEAQPRRSLATTDN